jgi:hypothetical protein
VVVVLTDVNIAIFVLCLPFGPVDSFSLGIRLRDLVDITVRSSYVYVARVPLCRIVLPSLDSPLDTLIIEVRVVLFLEGL